MTASMRAWRTHEYGERPTEVLRLDVVPLPVPDPGEVRVQVQAIPLNLNDLERITGGNMMVRPELPYSPGMEVMGVVDACGAGAEEWQGQRVVAMPKGANGGFAEYAICPVVSAFEMPDTIPLPDAAALYFPFHLAWLGLFDRAELQAGESVLIHAAAGGSGSAAIQLAVHRGARVFATAGSDEKVAALPHARRRRRDQLLRDRLRGRGARRNRQAGRRRRVRQRRRGVMEQSMRCTAYNGRYLMMGFASNKTVADEPFIVPRRVALGNFKLCGVLLAYAATRDVRLGQGRHGLELRVRSARREINREIVEPRAGRPVKPVIGKVVEFEELPAAMEAMANRETIGRTIVRLS